MTKRQNLTLSLFSASNIDILSKVGLIILISISFSFFKIFKMKQLTILLFFIAPFTINVFSQTPDSVFFNLFKKDSIDWAKLEPNRDENLILNILKSDPSVAACHGRDESSWKADINNRVKDFHLFDLNNDSLMDLIDENRCYQYIRTAIFLKTKTGSFKKIWDKPGRVVDIDFNKKAIISFKKTACCCDNTHEFNRIQFNKNEFGFENTLSTFWHFDAEMIDSLSLKRFFKTKKSIILRANPFVNDTLKPYECREEIKIKGNQIGEYREGVEVKVLSERVLSKKRWYFVMIPPNKGVVSRKDYLVFNDGKQYIFGWVMEKDLRK